jgi:hypothetical protein
LLLGLRYETQHQHLAVGVEVRNPTYRTISVKMMLL